MPRGRRKKIGRRGSATSAGSAISDAVAGLNTARSALVAQRDELDHQLGEIDRILMNMGGAPQSVRMPGRKPGRPAGRPSGKTAGGYRAGSLKSVLHGILASSGAPMRVQDITGRVQKAGYDSRNKTLAKSVGVALTQMTGVRKVKRGTFKLV